MSCRFSLTLCGLLILGLFTTVKLPVQGQSADDKLATVLQDLARAGGQAGGDLTLRPKSVQDAVASRRIRVDGAGNVRVYVLMADLSDDRVQALTAAGALVEIVDTPERRVQARVPIARLSAIAALPFVDFVRPPNYAVHRRAGAALTEGDAILKSDVVRNQIGLDGSGVRVGVLSDGLKGVFERNCAACDGIAGGPIATGDLPASTGTRNRGQILTASSGGILGKTFNSDGDLEGLPDPSPPCGFAGAGAEGTALLEIVHDMAPGAQLSFANADTDVAFRRAVNYLAANNDVVVDDLGFFGLAADGTSAVSMNTAAALNNPSNRIRTYITSVGNDADKHYLGTYASSGVDGTTISGVANSGNLHLFQSSGDTTDVLALGPQPHNILLLPRNGEAVVALTWDDKFGSSSNNYDLYLVQQSTGRVVARSTDVQSGAQDPVEFLDFTNTNATGYFYIVVQNVRNQAQPRQLNLYAFEPECAADGPRPLATGRHEKLNFTTPSRSVTAQSDAGGSPVGVISVGAICSGSPATLALFANSQTPDESCLDKDRKTIEFFSSRGPTLDGRTKPDVSAIDGVTVTGAGQFVNPFFGTSAAAPHVAGAAALLLQAAPCLAQGAQGALDQVTARSTLRDLILNSAAPLPDALAGNTFGAGVVDALASVQRTLPRASAPASVTFSGNASAGAKLSAADLGFTDPNGCALPRLAWSGGCGTSPGSSITCPFGTSSIRVAASSNGVSFSPPTDLQIAVTNFAMTVAPDSATIAAGETLQLDVSIAPLGGRFDGPVTLSCGELSAMTSCTFNPSIVKPGASAVHSTLTITTTAPTRLFVPVMVWGGPAFPAFWRRRRHVLAIAVAAAFSMSACLPGVPVVRLSRTSVSYPFQAIDSASAPQSVTLTNVGLGPLRIGRVTVSGDFEQSNSCGAVVAPAASCSLDVRFKPSAAGARSGAVTIDDNAPGGPHTIALSGPGFDPAAGTPPGTYAIAVVGTAGDLSHTTTAAVSVK